MMNWAPEVKNNGQVDAPSKERFTKKVRNLIVLYGFTKNVSDLTVTRIHVIYATFYSRDIRGTLFSNHETRP